MTPGVNRTSSAEGIAVSINWFDRMTKKEIHEKRVVIIQAGMKRYEDPLLHRTVQVPAGGRHRSDSALQ